jgi:hypothetical protein
LGENKGKLARGFAMKEKSNVVPLWDTPELSEQDAPDQSVQDTHWAVDVLPLADDNRHKCIRLMIPTMHEEFLYECLQPFRRRLTVNT